MAVTGAAGFGFTATGTFGGMVVGEFAGSALISATLAGAVGGFVGGAADVRMSGGSWKEAGQIGSVTALLGAVGGAGGALTAEALAGSGMSAAGMGFWSSAAGDVASQGVAMGAGLQDEFSVSQLGMAAGLGAIVVPNSGKSGRSLLDLEIPFVKRAVPAAPAEQHWRSPGGEMTPMQGELPMASLQRMYRSMTVRDLFTQSSGSIQTARTRTTFRGIALSEQQALDMVGEGVMHSNARRGGTNDAVAEANYLREARAWANDLQPGDPRRLLAGKELMQALHVAGSGPDSPGISLTLERGFAEQWAISQSRNYAGTKPFIIRAEAPVNRGVKLRGGGDDGYIGEFEITHFHEVRPDSMGIYEVLYDTIPGAGPRGRDLHVVTGYRRVGEFKK
jgi:hypothetical protein